MKPPAGSSSMEEHQKAVSSAFRRMLASPASSGRAAKLQTSLVDALQALGAIEPALCEPYPDVLVAKVLSALGRDDLCQSLNQKVNGFSDGSPRQSKVKSESTRSPSRPDPSDEERMETDPLGSSEGFLAVKQEPRSPVLRGSGASSPRSPVTESQAMVHVHMYSPDHGEAADLDLAGLIDSDREGSAGSDRVGSAGSDREEMAGSDREGMAGSDREEMAGSDREGMADGGQSDDDELQENERDRLALLDSDESSDDQPLVPRKKMSAAAVDRDRSSADSGSGDRHTRHRRVPQRYAATESVGTRRRRRAAAAGDGDDTDVQEEGTRRRRRAAAAGDGDGTDVQEEGKESARHRRRRRRRSSASDRRVKDESSSSEELIKPKREPKERRKPKQESVSDDAALNAVAGSGVRVEPDISDMRECYVLLSRLPPHLLEPALEGKSVTVKRQELRGLSFRERQIRRLTDIDKLLSSTSSKQSAASDSDGEEIHDDKRTQRNRSTRKPPTVRTKKKRTLNDMSADERSDCSDEAEDDPLSLVTPTLTLPQDRNEFDKQQLLDSDTDVSLAGGSAASSVCNGDAHSSNDEPIVNGKVKSSDKEMKSSDKETKSSDKETKSSDKETKSSDKKSKSSDEKAKSSDEDMESSDEKAKVLDDSMESSDKKAKVLDDSMESSDKKAKSSDKKAKSSEQKVKSSDENMESSDEKAKSSDENMESSDKKSSNEKVKSSNDKGNSSDKKANSSDEKVELSDEEAKQSDEEAKPWDDEANLPADKEKLSNGKETLSDKAEPSDEKAELSDDKAGLSDEKAELSDDKAELSDDKAGLSDGESQLSDTSCLHRQPDTSTNNKKRKSKSGRSVPAAIQRLLTGRLSATDSSEEDADERDKYDQRRHQEAAADDDEDAPEFNTTLFDDTSAPEEAQADVDAEEAAAAEELVADSDVEAAAEPQNDSGDEQPSAAADQAEANDDDDVSDEDFHKKKSPTKRRFVPIVDSDSDVCLLESEKDDADDDDEDDDSSSKKKRSRSSSGSGDDSDSADDFKPPPKSKRRRVQSMSDESSDDDSVIIEDNSDEEQETGEPSPTKSGRKNIRHIRQADLSTKQASQAEQARKERIDDKQKMYNKLFNESVDVEAGGVLDKLILDFDLDTKKTLVSVHKNFVKILKPHQVDGVKFMFDSTIETVKRLEENADDGGGCILGHCMGLGKTLQVIVLLHTILQTRATNRHISTALVICPKSTVQNWVRELKQWQRKCRVPMVDIVDITFRKDNYARSFELDQWRTEGGVCVLSYDMFKRFCGTGGKKGYNRKQLDRFQQALIDPGPDFVVCDEGHLLKNPKTAAFKSVNQVRTHRRIILTGTPLQNNLREYHTMVEFVKPRLLGSESEFSNRFMRPIENGSTMDAQPRDVRLMKRRSHVLHKLLDAVVQRRDYNVLTPFLPPKHEYVLMVRLGEVQRVLYQEYLDRHAARHSHSRGILADFQALSRIWTHPRSVQMKDQRDEQADTMRSEREAMKKFVNDSDDSTTEEEDEANNAGSDANGDQEDTQAALQSDWWKAFIPEDSSLDAVDLGGKLMLLMEMIIKAETIGDKTLVFSQSLFSLDLIEEHLKRTHREIAKQRSSARAGGDSAKHPADVYFGTWRIDYDYFRLDGSIAEDKRQKMCDKINRSSDERSRLMLISTRAGGLGINLVGANRVVIFDASWNPTADSQAIFRVFRFGQIKPCYIYRFLSQGTMEEKIYDRQITKLSLAGRVVDEQQIERHFSQHDVEELYLFEPDRKRTTGLTVPKDDLLLMELVSEQGKWVASVHGHDSLLQNLEEEELNEEEQRAAWEEYENDKRGVPNIGDVIPLVEGQTIDKETVIGMIKRDNPTATDEEVRSMIPKAIQTLRAFYFRRQQEQRAQQEREYMAAIQQQILQQQRAATSSGMAAVSGGGYNFTQQMMGMVQQQQRQQALRPFKYPVGNALAAAVAGAQRQQHRPSIPARRGGVPLGARGAMPAVRGAMPAVRGAMPAVRGAMPAVRGAMLMPQQRRSRAPVGPFAQTLPRPSSSSATITPVPSTAGKPQGPQPPGSRRKPTPVVDIG